VTVVEVFFATARAKSYGAKIVVTIEICFDESEILSVELFFLLEQPVAKSATVQSVAHSTPLKEKIDEFIMKVL
jgi:hypothetical protein